MKKRLICSIALGSLLVSLLSTCVYANEFVFSSSAVIENSGNKVYKAIRLSPEIYNNIKPNLADLMLYDQNNEIVPYFRRSFTQNTWETQKMYEMALLNSFIKDEYFYLDYALKEPLKNLHKDPLKEDIIATSIVVNTESDGFAKQVELWGGYDNKNWEKIKNDYLYKVEGNKNLEIRLNAKKYTHYRFKIANNLEKISFTSVFLKYDNIIKQKESFIGTLRPSFTVEEKEKETIVKVANVRNLKLDSITIETDSLFKRKFNFENGDGKTLYNLNFQNVTYKDMTLPLNSYVTNEDTAILTIENNDDKPIEIKSILVKYLADELVFDGSQGGNFLLRFGNEEIQTPPKYDIANFQEYIISEGYDVLNIKDIEVKPIQVKEQKSYDYKMIFNFVIVLVAVALGAIILRKLK